MKKLALVAAALMTAVAPMATAAPAAAEPYHGRQYDRDRHDGRHHNGRWDRDERRDHRRDDRRAYRQGYRDWDRRAHNGYYWNNRWYWGPPPVAYYGRPGFRADYRAWRRGDRLPGYYRSNYVVVRDYGYYHLRPPPRGYHWVRDDRGGYLLVGIATGIILSAILNEGYYDRY